MKGVSSMMGKEHSSILGMIFNIFRILGDVSHLLSFLILILKIRQTKSCYGKETQLIWIVGISFKTQGLYFIVFVTRYLDLYKVIMHPSKLSSGLILYNTIMKILYLSLTLYICNLMMRVSPYRTTYDKNGDTYKVVRWAILPAAILALFFHRKSNNFILDVFLTCCVKCSTSGRFRFTWSLCASCRRL